MSDAKALKVLFLSSDTGGGHRASAEALGAQFQRLFPGSTYDLLDIVKVNSLPPYNSIEDWYQHLSSNPSQWSLVYKLSNSPPVQTIVKTHLKLTTERSVRELIKNHDPDVVISVHPLMQSVPVISCAKISSETGRHLPFFTVVTDLGSGHCTWFEQGVEKMFIASDQIKDLAMRRGNVPEGKLVMSGLPIRYDFVVQANNLGTDGRTSFQGMIYQLQVREKLTLINSEEETYRKLILVMGGGEGVGSLSAIVNNLYIELATNNIASIILVACGRNVSLKESLENRDWKSLLIKSFHGEGSTEIHKGSGTKLFRIASRLNPVRIFKNEENNQIPTTREQQIKENLHLTNDDEIIHRVTVKPFGFITNVAEYMVASDLLISKAGPGTIAEAASVGLPVILTSFLPGQEEGNVEFVMKKKFGKYIPDSDPEAISKGVTSWLRDPDLMVQLSQNASSAGNPSAAENIVKSIGESTLRWKELRSEIGRI